MQNQDNVHLLSTQLSGIKGKINHLHTAVKVNSKINLPFKNIWYAQYVSGVGYEENNEYIVLFSESNRLSYDYKFVQWLKERYNAKTVFFFMNSVVQLPKGRIDYVNKTFDYIVSYDIADCKKYGWNYYCGVYCADKTLKKTYVDCDVFFVGRNKGRIAELKKAYKLFVSSGLNCEFYIVDVPDNEIDDCGIHYNYPLKYEEALRKVAGCKALYENLQKNQTGCTLRTYEAICYEKLLITNNDILEHSRIFDSKNMQIYNNVEDIDVNFIKNYEYQYNGISAYDLSPSLFMKYLEDLVHA